jgi:hypothetical protein
MPARMFAIVTIALLLAYPSAAKADVVLDWNAILVTTLTGQNPFAQARFAAIAHLAMFEAVNAVSGEYETYLGTARAPKGTSAEAAAASAAHRVLRTYFPGSAATLDEALAQSLATIPDGQGKNDGIAVGESAAAAAIAARAADGATPPQFFAPVSSKPGEWQTTPGCPPAGGILLHWGRLTTFGIEHGAQFRSRRPPALDSATYRRDYDEVKSVGDFNSTKRPPDRADVARFYAAVGAVPVWNPAARQVAMARGASLIQNARAFALLNMAISDGLVSSMETKYHYRFWRPETAIRAGDADGNRKTDGDAAFTPFITTPCFPSYPSAHASASYAARTVLAHIYGDHGHSIMLWSPAVAGVVLHYASLKQISADIDDARVYGGIHFRFDQAAGARQGRRVGEYVFRHQLRKMDCGRKRCR